tara:strand:- start:153 stop:560 length:408 start_codon:yes stop_codon:yes gene_type:complete
VSDEGRALMTIDVQTLQSGLRKLLAPGQPLPMEYVFTCAPPIHACMPDHISHAAPAHRHVGTRAREHACTPVARLSQPTLRRFIKAFYLPADDILEWARAHPEYSVKHLSGLVAVTGVNTMAKKKILSQLEKGGS